MIINMDNSSLDNKKNNSKYSPIFGMFDPLIVEKKLYDDAEAHALKCICELFENISLFY